MSRLIPIIATFVAALVLTAAPGYADRKVYWTDSGTAKIQRANLDGTSVEDLVTTGLTAPQHLVTDTDAGRMYWADVLDGKILRANLDGTGVVDLITGLVNPVGVAIDTSGGKIYWTDQGTSKVQRAELNGTMIEDLITGASTPIEIDLDVAAGKMYWTEAGSSRVLRADLDGSGSEDLVTGITGIRGLALDTSGGKMYWTDLAADKIQRANLDGTTIEDLVTAGLVSPSGVTLDVDGGKMYWTDAGTLEVRRADLDGTGEELLVSGLSSPIGIALDVSVLKCLDGTVNAGAGPITDVLFVSGTPVDDHHVTVNEGELLFSAMLLPPAGGPGKFVVHANLGAPQVSGETVLPASLGTFCFPLLLSAGGNPNAVWNNIGKENKVGASEYFDGNPQSDPDRAPTIYLQLTDGDAVNLPAGTKVTFQAVILDPASLSPKSASASNAITLEVL